MKTLKVSVLSLMLAALALPVVAGSHNRSGGGDVLNRDLKQTDFQTAEETRKIKEEGISDHKIIRGADVKD